MFTAIADYCRCIANADQQKDDDDVDDGDDDDSDDSDDDDDDEDDGGGDHHLQAKLRSTNMVCSLPSSVWFHAAHNKDDRRRQS